MKKPPFALLPFIAALVMMLSACSPERPLTPEEATKQLLGRVYDTYDKEEDCWNTSVTSSDPSLVRVSDAQFCMGIKRLDKVSTSSGERYYVVSTSKTSTHGCHACSGLVGLFIFEIRNQQPVVIASNPKVVQGIFGEPKDTWELVKLNSSDYWGWRTQDGEQGQGVFMKWDEIYAPFPVNTHKGKGDALAYTGEIRTLFGIETGYDDENTGFVSMDKEPKTVMETKLELDTSVSDALVYPIKATVTGIKKGKKLHSRTWLIPFDAKEWQYISPKNWPYDRE